MIMQEQLAQGTLIKLVPDWAPRREIIHAVFPSRRGLLPSIRKLIDFLKQRFDALEED
jgi:DNA-binding transcriptional LysR family regulator